VGPQRVCKLGLNGTVTHKDFELRHVITLRGSRIRRHRGRPVHVLRDHRRWSCGRHAPISGNSQARPVLLAASMDAHDTNRDILLRGRLPVVKLSCQA
jgi:hypothetical protein